MAKSKSPPKTSRAIILIALAVLLVLGSWMLAGPKPTEVIVVTFPNGTQIEAEVADTPEKLLFGLAFREELPPNLGMLYIFGKSDRHQVKTLGFQFPVDMIWADESRHVVHLIEDAEPCPSDPCPVYGPPRENARYLIQTVAGFIRQEHLAPGIELRFALRM
ncbi:MAG: DUF192 domain-containing protein [Nitrospiraceae bacterium]